MQPNNKYDIVKEVFFEEHFPVPKSDQENLLNESFDENEFVNKDEVIENLNAFWTLPSLKQRKYAKNFPLIIECIGINSITTLVDGIYKTNLKQVEDHVEVGLLICNHIEVILKSLETSKETHDDETIKSKIHLTILDFLKLLIESKNHELLLNSRKKLVTIAHYLNDSNYNNELLTIILTLLHDNINEQNRLGALNLITKLHARFSKSYIEGFIATDIIALMQDPKIGVRVEAYKTFFVILDSFDPEFIERKFFSLIEKMSEDDNNNIRLIFVQNIPLMSKKLDFKKFEFKILPKYINTLASKNRFVKEEAFLNLGVLIVTLLQSNSASNIREIYHSNMFDKIYDKYFEIPYLIKKMNLSSKKKIIRANFGILKKVTMIKKTTLWQRIKKLYIYTEDIDKQIIEMAKLELAAQLDHIAEIMDHNIVENELIKLIDKKYLTIGPTASEKVKQTTIKVLSGVLKQLNKETREKFADVYQLTMSQDIRKWRFRFVIAEQFDSLTSLFNPLTTVQKFVPMIFSFCKDNCAVVRKRASRNIWMLLKNIQTHELGKQVVTMNIKEFGKYNRFSLRQSFILMMEGILINLPESVDDEMVAILKNLAGDKVVNNQIALAMLLGILKKNEIKTDWEMVVLKELMRHPDIDLFTHLREIYVDKETATVLDKELNRMRNKRRATVQGEKDKIEKIKKSRSSMSDGENSVNSLKIHEKDKGVIEGIMPDESYEEYNSNSSKEDEDTSALTVIYNEWKLSVAESYLNN